MKSKLTAFSIVHGEFECKRYFPCKWFPRCSERSLKSINFPGDKWRSWTPGWKLHSHKCVMDLTYLLLLKRVDRDSLPGPLSQSCPHHRKELFSHPGFSHSDRAWGVLPLEKAITSSLQSWVVYRSPLFPFQLLFSLSLPLHILKLGSATGSCVLSWTHRDTEGRNRKSHRNVYQSRDFSSLTLQTFQPIPVLQFTSEPKQEPGGEVPSCTSGPHHSYPFLAWKLLTLILAESIENQLLSVFPISAVFKNPLWRT